jgi:hypothetical protein
MNVTAVRITSCSVVHCLCTLSGRFTAILKTRLYQSFSKFNLHNFLVTSHLVLRIKVAFLHIT